MKKLIFAILFVLTAGVAVSCSEENIEPQSGNGGAGEVQKY
ncbi:MAG: hypothetical protein AB7O48_11320 [Cyclobacteriaceae bacterium]